jgi:tungstate transport system ATP-binding protein
MLQLDGVTRRYDDETVFEDVSLAVEPGEVLGIIGPSGVGKTTLLRLFALFEPPDAGTVAYDGTDVWSASEERRLDCRRSVGMVFQESSLFSTSVRRNVAYGLRVRSSRVERLRRDLASLVRRRDGTVAAVREALELAGFEAKAESIARRNGTTAAVREALELVGLGEKADQDARSLSGGEAQRVAFARAVAYDPDVILLDEPTSDLDPRNTALIEEAVTDARDRGIGIVAATHDMNQAKRIADRVAVMLGDGLVEVGPAEGIFDSPRDERTRKFITGELVY